MPVAQAITAISRRSAYIEGRCCKQPTSLQVISEERADGCAVAPGRYAHAAHHRVIDLPELRVCDQESGLVQVEQWGV